MGSSCALFWMPAVMLTGLVEARVEATVLRPGQPPRARVSLPVALGRGTSSRWVP